MAWDLSGIMNTVQDLGATIINGIGAYNAVNSLIHSGNTPPGVSGNNAYMQALLGQVATNVTNKPAPAAGVRPTPTVPAATPTVPAATSSTTAAAASGFVQGLVSNVPMLVIGVIGILLAVFVLVLVRRK
jgi:hypothetical protein